MAKAQLARHVPSRGWTVEMVTGTDDRIDAAVEIEADAMAELGDLREEVLDEFAPVNGHSLFLLLFPSDSTGEMSECHGIARFIPSTGPFGNKTLNDVAHLTAGADDDEARRAVEDAFLAQSGCDSILHCWDIATLAFPVSLAHKERIMASVELFSTVGHVLKTAMDSAGISHVTSFNQVDFHAYLTSTVGVPFANLRDPNGTEYGELKYDTYASGEAMVAMPAWSALTHLLDHVFDPQRADPGTLAHEVASKIASASPAQLTVSTAEFIAAARPNPVT